MAYPHTAMCGKGIGTPLALVPLLLIILCFQEGGGLGDTTVPPLPQGNVWLTLAKAFNQSALCLSMATPQAPFHMCLVRIPMDDPQATVAKAQGREPHISCNTSMVTRIENFDMWDDQLPLASSEPRELEILRSIKADVCVYFNYSKLGKRCNSDPYCKMTQDVSPTQFLIHNSSSWCNQTITNKCSVYYALTDSLP